MVFGLTNRPTIVQNHEKSRSKNRLVSDIDFGPLFLTFGLPKAPKSVPKSSQNPPKWTPNRGWGPVFWATWSPNPQKWSQGVKKSWFWTPKLPPRAQKSTPKPPQELKKYSKTTLELKFYMPYLILYTSHFHIWHFALLRSQNDPKEQKNTTT